MCHQSRRNSPSVTAGMPIDSCSAITSLMQRSCTAFSAAASISPLRCLARASCSSRGRSRLPTWSARNGGFIVHPRLSPSATDSDREGRFVERACRLHLVSVRLVQVEGDPGRREEFTGCEKTVQHSCRLPQALYPSVKPGVAIGSVWKDERGATEH